MHELFLSLTTFLLRDHSHCFKLAKYDQCTGEQYLQMLFHESEE